MIRRLLVANRGEIACRIIRTARRLGIETVAVCSAADARAPFVRLADRAQLLGPAPARESYLVVDRVLDAAVAHGCDALHPGYGFLSENPALASACAARGVVFVGPDARAITALGDKGNARRLALAAGCLPVPGYDGPDDDPSLLAAARGLGFPLLVKAARGGGGKGLKLAGTEDEFASAVASARREALAAFGDPSLILERFVHPARHLEVQILGDRRGTVRGVLERECSLQRRHQKVVEECPGVGVSAALRRELVEAAERLAREAGYQGAGTVEFLLEPSGRFHFLEMNTRLQVEHGVTELVTGLDLVEWQLRIAAGEALELPATIEPAGHAIEVRLYAEDPSRDFLPMTGRVRSLRIPGGPGIRVDHGLEPGLEITAHYDPLLMKLMAHAPTREAARRRLVAALEECELRGLETNQGYLLDLLESPAMVSGAMTTRTLEAWSPPSRNPPPEVLLLAAAGMTAGAPAGRSPDSPYARLLGFRLLPGEDR
jgi:acetyl/propionyl-CoA carboxylase alpha subunit